MSMHAQRYARTQVETATPGGVLLELFDSALARITAGARALDEGRPTEAVNTLTSASDIVAALQAALSPARAPELCAQLADVYTFAALRLTQSALRRDPILAREAERALRPIAEGFREAVAVTRGVAR